jgi:hypothetical protein
VWLGGTSGGTVGAGTLALDEEKELLLIIKGDQI